MPKRHATSARSSRTPDTWKGRPRLAPIPKSRDPFINAPLISVGPGPDGVARYWISTWNAHSGCLAALVTRDGRHRLYRFPPALPGFYSAVIEGPDTLWLCGFLSHIVRLSLATGSYETFETGAPRDLVFQGMRLDPVTGKLFVSTIGNALSFDTRTRRTVKLHAACTTLRYSRFSFPNGDGSYSFVIQCPDEGILRWDPRDETTETLVIRKHMDTEQIAGGTSYRLIEVEGRWYIPNAGWYDPARRVVDPAGPRPAREATWFGRRDHLAYGWNIESGWDSSIVTWDLRSGVVAPVCVMPEAGMSVALDPDDALVAVTLYGDFLRCHARTGALEVARRLPADSIGHVDCLRRIDRDRVLGTPFITQRFWEADLRTRRGRDCGRATSGVGEVLQTWSLRGRIYMASYTRGELVEYDPRAPARYPENPRVVARPHDAMRPVAATDDGRRLFYACSAPYGRLGSTVVRYDTATGESRCAVNPLPDQQIHSLWYDRAGRALLAGSTNAADCNSCPPSSDRCYFARLDPETLAVRDTFEAPPGASGCQILGPMGSGRWLCRVVGKTAAGAWFARFFVVARDAFRLPPPEADLTIPDCYAILYAGRPGLFVLLRDAGVELWDVRARACRRRLYRDPKLYRMWVQDASVLFVNDRSIGVLDDCLA